MTRLFGRRPVVKSGARRKHGARAMPFQPATSALRRFSVPGVAARSFSGFARAFSGVACSFFGVARAFFGVARAPRAVAGRRGDDALRRNLISLAHRHDSLEKRPFSVEKPRFSLAPRGCAPVTRWFSLENRRLFCVFRGFQLSAVSFQAQIAIRLWTHLLLPAPR